MGDSFERGDPFEAYETFDAIHAAGMTPAELPGELEDGAPLEGRHGAGAPSLMSYGASSTLRYESGADAIPTSVTVPAGAEPATPVPEPSPAPQELGSPLSGRAAADERRAKRDQRTHLDERERLQHMDRWEDSAMGAMAKDESRAASATAPGASGVAPGAETSATGATGATGAAAGESTPRVTEWTVEVDETQAPPRALQIALVVGAAALSGLAIAGGITWLVIQRRRLNAAREMERAIAASRILRLTPTPARPYMREASQAREAAMQYAQQSAAETARMARALRQAAGLSAGTARDYASERAALAQEIFGGALDTTRGGATGAWRTVSRLAPEQTQRLARAFNAGRSTGRIEQRAK